MHIFLIIYYGESANLESAGYMGKAIEIYPFEMFSVSKKKPKSDKLFELLFIRLNNYMYDWFKIDVK